jgi:putative transposase
LTEREREELLQISKLRSTPQSVALRVRIVLSASEGIANKVLARQLSTTLPTVLLWRARYQVEGLAGILEDRPRSGRPKEIFAQQEAALIETTLHRTPKERLRLRIFTQSFGQSSACPASHCILHAGDSLQPRLHPRSF